MIDNIVNEIQSKTPKNREYLLVAIDGRGGSGKTTLAGELVKRLPGFTLLNGDDYWEPSDDNEFGWFNEPRFVKEVLEPLSRGERSFEYRPYVWASEPHIQPRELQIGAGVIVERCYSMRLPANWDYTIWVDVSPELSLERGIERNSDQRQVWDNVWRPREDEYINTEAPQDHADIVLDGSQPIS